MEKLVAMEFMVLNGLTFDRMELVIHMVVFQRSGKNISDFFFLQEFRLEEMPTPLYAMGGVNRTSHVSHTQTLFSVRLERSSRFAARTVHVTPTSS